MRLSRRRLLLSAGASALTLPFLGRIPSAHAEGFPTRLLVFYTPQEPISKAHWMPGAGFSLTDVMQPLTPHRNKIVMVGNMKVASAGDDKKAGHNLIGHILTNQLNNYFGATHQFYAGGISVDHYIAQKLGVSPLILGVGVDRSFGTYVLSYSDKDKPAQPQVDPKKAFDSIFGNLTLPEDQQADATAQRKRILDLVSGHLASLRPQLPQADRTKLDQHLSEVEALESKLQAAPVTCSPVGPAGGLDPKNNAHVPELTRRQIDVMVQALACDATRVGTLQVGGSGGFGTPQWPDEGVNIAKGDHDIAHEFYSKNTSQAIADREALERYHYAQFAYLLQQMDSVQEGGGTLLDHSLVFWVKSMSHGHNHDPMMMMLAGGAGGALQGGRFIDAGGAPTANLLVTVCNLMGLPDTSFGNPKYCTGALSV